MNLYLAPPSHRQDECPSCCLESVYCKADTCKSKTELLVRVGFLMHGASLTCRDNVLLTGGISFWHASVNSSGPVLHMVRTWPCLGEKPSVMSQPDSEAIYSFAACCRQMRVHAHMGTHVHATRGKPIAPHGPRQPFTESFWPWHSRWAVSVQSHQPVRLSMVM